MAFGGVLRNENAVYIWLVHMRLQEAEIRLQIQKAELELRFMQRENDGQVNHLPIFQQQVVHKKRQIKTIETAGGRNLLQSDL